MRELINVTAMFTLFLILVHIDDIFDRNVDSDAAAEVANAVNWADSFETVAENLSIKADIDDARELADREDDELLEEELFLNKGLRIETWLSMTFNIGTKSIAYVATCERMPVKSCTDWMTVESSIPDVILSMLFKKLVTGTARDVN